MEKNDNKTDKQSSQLVLWINEAILFSDKIEYCCPYTGPKKGTIYVTNYRLLFIPITTKLYPIKRNELKKPEFYDVSKNLCYYVHIFISNILAIEKNYVNPTYAAKKVYYSISLDCMDGRCVKFVIPLNEAYCLPSFIQAIQNGMKMYETIVPHPTLCYRPNTENNGWKSYCIEKEFDRITVSHSQWSLESINTNYLLCETYPQHLGVLNSLNIEMYSELAMLFSKNRVPILCWQHPYNQAPLIRSANPVPNLSEQLHMKIYSFISSVIDSCPLSTNFYIIDTQSKEDDDTLFVVDKNKKENIPSFETIYLNIANIHIMRESLYLIQALCNPGIDDSNWIARLESTKWLDHIHSIINGACIVVDIIERKNSPALVMCTDGWDRTPQVTSLAMLCLDPYYRTINGFACLIEKEWCYAGHKFSQRNGFYDESKKTNQKSPLFLQFIECVYNIINKFPHSFEFNEEFLIAILDGMNSRLYGNFLVNSMKLRDKLSITLKTTSLWSDLLQKTETFINPLYLPEYYNKVILPKFCSPSIKFWKNYHMRYNPMVYNKVNPYDINLLINQKLSNLDNVLKC